MSRVGDGGGDDLAQTVATAELAEHLSAVVVVDDPAPTRVLAVDLDGPDAPAPPGLRAYPGVTVGLARAPSPPAAGTVAADLDVLLTTVADPPAGWVAVDDLVRGLALVERAVAATPLAARVAVDVLRHAEQRSVPAGLVAESHAYSMLLAGPEFARWLAGREPGSRDGDRSAPVRVEREGSLVRVVLARPHVHNAFDARMREHLTDALIAVSADASRPAVVLCGDGPTFCSGGDLREFGTAADPVTAHVVRTTRGPARWLAELGPRITARVHGTCIGAGVELPAFAGRVEAAPGTTFRLPELGMGLIPGAGGTVSVTARIGRQRATWMALTGGTIDTGTALAWGLADTVT